jgi:hypothetical protein
MTRGTAVTVAVLIAMITVGQVIALHHKFSEAERRPSNRTPVFLREIAGISMGFVLGHHGARFITLSSNDLPRGGADYSTELARLKAVMQTELDRIPLKIIAEAVWYFAVVFFVVCRPLAVSWRRRASPSSLAATGATVLFAATVVFQVPIAFGYDGSIFSNWVGPGAYSYSRPYVGVTGISGVTVSYRPFLEAMITPATKALRPLIWSDEGLPFWPGVAAVAFVYGCVGAAVGYVGGAFRKMRERTAG